MTTKMPSRPDLFTVIRNKLREQCRYLSSDWRMLPDFIIIGAARSGTTSLYNYLVQHPQILPAFKKEIHFFDYKFSRGLRWYRLHFPLKWSDHKRKITGEASAYYMFHPLVPERMAHILPDVRLICLLRHPVNRALSSYYNQVRLGLENRKTFEEAIENEMEVIPEEEQKIIKGDYDFSFTHKYHSYLSRGIYVTQLKRWLQYFKREQLLILNSEEFYENTPTVFSEVIKFLGLQEWMPDTFKPYNAGGEYPEIDSSVRERLMTYYAPYNQQLYALIGRTYNW
jgi:hypothetical protein